MWKHDFGTVRAVGLVAALCLTLAIPTPADAAQRPIPKKSVTAVEVKKCKKGEIWNKKKKMCIKTESGLLTDEELLDQATVLSADGHYEWALHVLSVAANPEDPEILGLKGYSYRKAGRLDAAIEHYGRALALAPDHIRIREYLGEGYVAAGGFLLARAQLEEIASRCGTDCPEYLELQAVISASSSQDR
jgi:tetratricopeptide (TPR) repeat protein